MTRTDLMDGGNHTRIFTVYIVHRPTKMLCVGGNEEYDMENAYLIFNHVVCDFCGEP